MLQLPGIRDGPTLRTALCRKDYVAKIINWLYVIGRLQEYRLVKQLEEEVEEEELKGRNPIPPTPTQRGNADNTTKMRRGRRRNRVPGF